MKVCGNPKCKYKGKPQMESNFWKIYKNLPKDTTNIQFWCIDCKNEYKKANPEKNIEYQARWIRNNPEKVKDNWDNWVKNNLERRREIARKSAKKRYWETKLQSQNETTTKKPKSPPHNNT